MVWRAALTVVVAALVTLALLWTFQRQLIYFPDTSPPPPAASVLPGARDITLRTADGLALGAWFVPPMGADRGVAVLLAPGNAGNRANRTDFADALRRQGFAVLLMDYRGFGGNPGRPSERGLAHDADAAVAALRELGYPPERTLYFGESLGTGVVASLQERHPPAGIVLRSPFSELADVGTHHYRWLPITALLRDRFPVAEPMARSAVPTAVIFGDRDSIVPPALSAQVAESVGTLAKTVILPGADHNDAVMFGPRVAAVVAALGDRIGRGTDSAGPDAGSLIP